MTTDTAEHFLRLLLAILTPIFFGFCWCFYWLPLYPFPYNVIIAAMPLATVYLLARNEMRRRERLPKLEDKPMGEKEQQRSGEIVEDMAIEKERRKTKSL